MFYTASRSAKLELMGAICILIVYEYNPDMFMNLPAYGLEMGAISPITAIVSLRQCFECGVGLRKQLISCRDSRGTMLRKA